MLKIVHFAKFYFPIRGGIESVTLSLANGAVAAGNLVKVICFHKTKSLLHENINGVSVTRAPYKKIISSQPISLSYLVECYKAAKFADIVHLHAPNILAALCCLFINRKVKILIHWHSDILNKGYLTKFIRPLEFIMLRRADCIITTSEVYFHASNELNRFKNKISYIPIGVLDRDRSQIADASLPLSISNKIFDKQIILSVGRLVSYKGFEYLVRSAQFINDSAVILIVGDGPLKHSLELEIKKFNLENKVFLLGSINSDLLHNLFLKSTLYCLSSTDRAEAFGVVLLEAMSYSLPIVATNINGSGVPWVNKHEISGVNVPVKDSQAIALACNKILLDSKLRSKFSKGSRDRFIEYFTEKIFIDKILLIYDEIMVT